MKKMNKTIIQDKENPEWTDEMFAKACPAREVLEEDFGKEAAALLLSGNVTVRKMGRPRSETKKELLTLRIDPEIANSFRAMGKGWQTQMNSALKQWLAEHHA